MTDTSPEAVERLAATHATSDGWSALIPDPVGGYVRHSDYAALLTRLQEVEAERIQGQRDYCDLMDRHDAHFSAWRSAKLRAEQAEAALTEARRLARQTEQMLHGWEREAREMKARAEQAEAALTEARAETAAVIEAIIELLVAVGIAGDADADPLATALRGVTPASTTAALDEIKRQAREEALREERARAMLRRGMNAPEDPHVEALCERYGYGAVMDAASRLWARKDSLGAFFIGGCIGLRSDDEARALIDQAPEKRQ